jgi:hypothetical protein
VVVRIISPRDPAGDAHKMMRFDPVAGQNIGIEGKIRDFERNRKKKETEE